MGKPRCPEAFSKADHDVDSCSLDDGRVCLLESGTECSTYQEYLAKYERDSAVVPQE